MKHDYWPNEYVCLKTNFFSAGDYSIHPIHIRDAEEIRRWRNSQMNVLRQNTPIDSSTQISYFRDTILPSFFLHQPEQLLFSFQHKHILIGYGGLVHIAWEKHKGEMSFLVAKARAANLREYTLDLANFINLIRKVASEIGLNEITTETYMHRSSHMLLLEKNGFTRIVEDRDQVSVNHRLEVASNEY